jgi:hypothetical protein
VGGINRRRFLGMAVGSIAGAEFVGAGSVNPQFSKISPSDLPAIKPGTNTSFGSLKQIDAGAMPMARRITRTPVCTPRNSLTNMRIGTSRAGSVTICLKRPRRPLLKLSSTSTASDRQMNSGG